MAIATTTQAIQTDFGRIAQQGVQQIQQSQLLEEQRQERQYKKMQDLEDRYGIPPEDFTLKDTEFRTLNDVQAEAMSSARDSYFDVFKQLENEPTNIELKKKLSRIKGSVASIRAANEKFMSLGEEYLTKLENDEISGVDEDDLFKNLQAIEKGRYKQRFDEDGRLQILTYDKDGKLEDTLSYKELINRDVISRVKVEEELDLFMKRIGEDNLTTAEGGRLMTRNEFGDRQEQSAMDYINSTLGEGEETLEDNPALADLLYQASGRKIKKREKFTEDERTQVKEWMMSKIKGRYNNTVSISTDAKWAQQQANYRTSLSGSGKTEIPSGADSINIATKDNQPQIASDGSVVFTLTQPSKIDATKSDKAVNRIRYNPKTDAVVLESQDRIKMSSKEEAEKIQKEGAGNLLKMIKEADGKGGFTYYAVTSGEISSATETGTKEINTYASYNQMQNVKNLKQILKNKYYSQFESPEAAEQFLGQQQQPTQPAFSKPSEESMSAAAQRIAHMRKQQEQMQNNK